MENDIIDIHYKKPSKWSAKFCAPWGDKMWKVFRNGNMVGQIGWSLARTEAEAIKLTKVTIAQTDRKYCNLRNIGRNIGN